MDCVWCRRVAWLLMCCVACVGDEARPIEGGSGGGGAGCPTGETDCGGCVDLQTNREHCGACNTPCAPEDVCSLGQCGSDCMGGLARCGNQCVDTMTDVEHCGSCDMPCAGPPAHGQPICDGAQCGIDCDDDALVGADGMTCDGCADATILEGAPLVYWRLGEASGATAIDASGNGEHGVYTSVGLGAPGVASDGDTAAVLGTPSDSRVVRDDFATFPATAITAELWLRTSATNSGTPFSYNGAGNDNAFLIYDPTNIELQVMGQPIVTGVSLNDGVWHHVAVTWESASGALVLFVDGEAAFTATLAQGATILSGGALVLGQEQDCVAGCFDSAQRFIGEMDEVVVFDRVLSTAELVLHEHTVTCMP